MLASIKDLVPGDLFTVPAYFYDGFCYATMTRHPAFCIMFICIERCKPGKLLFQIKTHIGTLLIDSKDSIIIIR